MFSFWFLVLSLSLLLLLCRFIITMRPGFVTMTWLLLKEYFVLHYVCMYRTTISHKLSYLGSYPTFLVFLTVGWLAG